MSRIPRFANDKDDPFPPFLRTGNMLSDYWRYVRVTAGVSWHLLRRTLGRIAHDETLDAER